MTFVLKFEAKIYVITNASIYVTNAFINILFLFFISYWESFFFFLERRLFLKNGGRTSKEPIAIILEI